MYSIEEYDREKTKVLKYVIYKKRTIREIKTKFKPTIEENMLEDIIEELKENGYINDFLYIQKTVDEFQRLKNLSIKELEYKLLSKGINKHDLEDYISQNKEDLLEYEINSARNIFIKKQATMEKEDVVLYLKKKGYLSESITLAQD